MQLKIRFQLNRDLNLPISYQHILQAVIYHALEETPEYSSFLHDIGYSTGSRSYKAFTFSYLAGRYGIEGKRIRFFDEVSFEVRSPDETFIRVLEYGMMHNGISFAGSDTYDPEITVTNRKIRDEEIRIQMRTPICVCSTDPESRKTYYYDPSEEEFYREAADNFCRKYYACCQEVPCDGIRLSPVAVSDRDKVVAKFKDFYLTGWKGKYLLEGEPEYLDFLYQTGIGARNSQGFGLFDIVR